MGQKIKALSKDEYRGYFSAAYVGLAAITGAAAGLLLVPAVSGQIIDKALLIPGVLFGIACLFFVYLTFTPMLHLWPHPRQETAGRLDQLPELYELMDYYHDHTAVQADTLVAPALGRAYEVSGSVYNVDQDSIHLDLQGKTRLGSTRSVFLRSAENDWQNRIALLKKGQWVIAKGRLVRIDEHSFSLDDCEIIE